MRHSSAMKYLLPERAINAFSISILWVFALSINLFAARLVESAQNRQTRTVTSPMEGEQTDLSGSYSGIVSYPEGGLIGEATLRIIGNQFTLESGATTLTGHITAVTTGNYTAVAMQFDHMPTPMVISLRALKTDDRLALTSVPGERREFSFTGIARRRSGRRGARRSARRDGGDTPSPSPYPTVPDFPWPPPRASAIARIEARFLRNPSGQTFLRDVSARLERAFDQAGYGEISWYAVPGGFALVSRLEQFNADGTPLNVPDRWSAEVARPHINSLGTLLSDLFTARQGHYRIIVFIVTSAPVPQSDRPLSRAEAMELIARGTPQLPASIGDLEFTQNHSCTALIYEFEQATPDHRAEFKYPSILDGPTHLRRCGIWASLER